MRRAWPTTRLPATTTWRVRRGWSHSVQEGSHRPSWRQAWRPRPRASAARDALTSRETVPVAHETVRGAYGPPTPATSVRRHAAVTRARYARTRDPCRGARDPDRAGTDP